MLGAKCRFDAQFLREWRNFQHHGLGRAGGHGTGSRSSEATRHRNSAKLSVSPFLKPAATSAMVESTGWFGFCRSARVRLALSGAGISEPGSRQSSDTARHLPSVSLTAVGSVAGIPRIAAVSFSVTIPSSHVASTASSARPDRPLPFMSTKFPAATELFAMSTITACGLVTGEVTFWASLPSPSGMARHAASGSRRNMSTAACDQTCDTSGTSARFHGVSVKLRRLVCGSNCAFRNTSKSVPMIASPA